MNIDTPQQPVGGAFNPASTNTSPQDIFGSGSQQGSNSGSSNPHPVSARSSHNVTVYQTTGPDAYTDPILANDGSGPVLNPRSCVTCRRRKVRCDKQMPCSNCRRALIPCVFPAPGRAPRQPRPKDPNAPPKPSTSQREVELTKRLRKLEGIVEELSGQIEVESGGKNPSSAGSPSSPAMNSATKRASTFGRGGSTGISPREAEAYSDHTSDIVKRDISSALGRLVLNDHKGNTRYVTNGFWAKLNDELDALREDTQRLTSDMSDDSDIEQDDTPEESPQDDKGNVEDHHAFILGYRSADVDLRGCQPLPSHVPFLWSVYQENVEPLIKILHIPTVDALMKEARRGPDRLSPGNECLVFAICFSAIVSLEPEEVKENFNLERNDLLRQYRFALEQSLARANYLYTSELVVLQAFALFLVVVRRVDDSRFCWTLTGLIIRIAQGMGVHRDGSQFDLTPYEIEMRRRVWWAILILDLRSAEEVGSDLTVTEQSFDTKLPTNINDADISPSSTELPEPHEGRSDTAVVLARCEVLLLSRRFLTELSMKNAELSPADRERILIDAYRRVEHRFIKHAFDEGDSLYWMISIVARIIVAKMCLNLYQSKIFPGNDDDISAESRDRIFVAAIEVVELGHKLNSDPRCKQYRWLFMTYTNWHAIAFNLIELCRRPWTALVERSWEAIRYYDRDPVDVRKAGDHAAIFLPLRKLYARARKHREAEILRLRANPDEARRMDWQERMNPSTARFGPVSGMEGRMEEVRMKWWSMVRPDGPSPRAANMNVLMPMPTNNSNSNKVASLSAQDSPLTQVPTPNTTQSNIPATQSEQQAGFQNQAMELLDDIMAQPTPNISSFWSLNMTPNGFNDKGLGMAMDGTNATTDTQGQQQQQPQQQITPPSDALRRQALALQQQATADDNNLPPYLWSHGWGDNGSQQHQPTSQEQVQLDGSGNADLDMLEGDFDWREWGNTLATFDMGGMPPPAPL